MHKRKVVLYISMSLDGYIATKDDDISWLSVAQKEGLDYGYYDLQQRVDTYIVGRRTYDVVLGLTGGTFEQANLFDCYIISKNERPSENGVKFYSGEIEDLINDIRSKPGKDIYCDGGSQIVKLFMEKNLIDEYIITIMPTVLGEGIRLFQGGIDKIDLELEKSESFETGVVQVHYKRKK